MATPNGASAQRRLRRELNLPTDMRAEFVPTFMAARSHETFCAEIERFFPQYSDQYKTLAANDLELSEAFHHIKRDSGERYIEHLRGATLIVLKHGHVRHLPTLITTQFHDSVEDLPEWTCERIARRFGEEVAANVAWVTKRDRLPGEAKWERDHEYRNRMRGAPTGAKQTKLGDFLHNLTTLWVQPEDHIVYKYFDGQMFYLPMAEEQGFLAREMRAVLTELPKRHQFLRFKK